MDTKEKHIRRHNIAVTVLLCMVSAICLYAYYRPQAPKELVWIEGSLHYDGKIERFPGAWIAHAECYVSYTMHKYPDLLFYCDFDSDELFYSDHINEALQISEKDYHKFILRDKPIFSNKNTYKVRAYAIRENGKIIRAAQPRGEGWQLLAGNLSLGLLITHLIVLLYRKLS